MALCHAIEQYIETGVLVQSAKSATANVALPTQVCQASHMTATQRAKDLY